MQAITFRTANAVAMADRLLMAWVQDIDEWPSQMLHMLTWPSKSPMPCIHCGVRHVFPSSW